MNDIYVRAQELVDYVAEIFPDGDIEKSYYENDLTYHACKELLQLRELHDENKRADTELIEFIWKLLVNDIADGDTPSDEQLQKVRAELTKRGLPYLLDVNE